MTKPRDDNTKPIKEAIAAAAEKIEGLKKDRSVINSAIEAEITALEAMGVNRHAFRFAMKYASNDEGTREGFDIGYELAREALGFPVQADLFDIDKVKQKHTKGDDDDGTQDASES